MSEGRISKTECDLLSMAINKIVSTEVLEKSISDQLPLTDDLSDANKIYYGKVSVLFVDMRESTKLPDEFSTEQLVKIYRSYVRTVVQAVRYSGGIVRDFMGDGVLAVFVDDVEGTSEDKSVHAARYITTAIDKFLNPVLDQEMKYRISCGIGIHTGDISLSKVGMKGKEQDNEAENEFGIAWIGNSTNLACKFSSAVDNGALFISASTYAALSDLDGKQEWKKIKILKGSQTLSGYIARQYYLQLDEDINPCVAKTCSTTLSLVDVLRAEYDKQLVDISKRSEELGRKEQELQSRESHLNTKSLEVECKKNKNHVIENELHEHKYLFYCEMLRSGHCKTTYVKEMGESFWEENLEAAIAAGKKTGKNEHEVKQEISYAMVSIFESMEMWDKAYDFLVEQATGYSWLYLFTVQKIVKEIGYCGRLKSAIYVRLAQNDLSPENRIEFEKIKHWMVYDYNG